jgi:hypothetical protein
MNVPPEIWSMVAQYINDGKTWKAFLQTYTMFSCFASDDKTLALSNPLWTLIEKHLDRDWNWESISANEWTTFDIVAKYPDKPWTWEILVQRLVFPEEFLFEAIEILREFPIKDEYDYAVNLMYIKIVEHMDLLIRNKNLPENFLLEYHQLFDACEVVARTPWNTLKKIPDLQICEHACLNPTAPFDELDPEILDFDLLSYNTGLTISFFEKHLYQDWDFHILSHNSVTTVCFIELAPDEAWDWYVLSGSFHGVDMFKKFQNKPWDYNQLSYNRSLTLATILEHKDKPWYMGAVSNCLKLSIDDVRAHPELHWDYTGLLGNESIPLETLLKEFTLLDNGLIIHNSLKNSGMHHHLAMLSYEQAIDIDGNELYCSQELLSYRDHPMRDIIAHPEINWDYETLSYGSNLSWLYVDQNPELFDFDSISGNQFKRC